MTDFSFSLLATDGSARRGQITTSRGEINTPAKWILCFAMLLGRLEVFTLLVLFTPMFWRR